MLITWMISALALECWEPIPCVHEAACSGEEWPSPFTASDNRDKAFVIALFTCITLTAMGVIPEASSTIPESSGGH